MAIRKANGTRRHAFAPAFDTRLVLSQAEQVDGRRATRSRASTDEVSQGAEVQIRVAGRALGAHQRDGDAR